MQLTTLIILLKDKILILRREGRQRISAGFLLWY